MHLYLMRHGDKDLYGVGSDPGLSAHGQKQAQGLLEHFKSIPTDAHVILLASPKIRTQQTLQPLQPLATARHTKIKVMPDLTERTHIETHTQFQNRVEKFLTQLTQTPSDSHCIVCTHSDWLEIAMHVLPMDLRPDDPRLPQFFSTTQYLHFELVDEIWRYIGQGVG